MFQPMLTIESKPVNLELLTLDANKKHEGDILCEIAGMKISMLVDSGSGVNAITEMQFNQLMQSTKHRVKVHNVKNGSEATLKAFAQATPLEVIATFEAKLWISEKRPSLTEKFYVIKNATRALISRDTAIRHRILLMGFEVPRTISQDKPFHEKVCLQIESKEIKEFPKFGMDPGKINIDTTVLPRRSTYCNIEPAFEEATDQRLQEMLESGIIEKCEHGMNRDFCSALLAVPKGATDFRLVVDLRGPNTCIIRNPHRMPTIESIMSKLHGATVFTNLDLTNGFFHVELDESSRHVTNFYTGKGYFRYKRLPFGLCNAQEAMERILTGCEGVLIYLDDILIYGKDNQEHDKRFTAAMGKLKSHNVKINEKKSKYRVESCTFLGFRIDKNGYHITNDRLEHVKAFRRPTNLKELQSFLA